MTVSILFSLIAYFRQNNIVMPRVQPIHTDTAAEEIKEAFSKHVATYPSTRITNMKATLGHSLPAFEVYMQWYPLYEEVKKITGNRLAYLFAHAISQGSACPLCTTYFRKLIIENGERPDQLALSSEDQELLDFGSAIATSRGVVEVDIFQPIRERYSDKEIVVLTAFAGIMIATNLFNNVLDVDIDDYLFPYQSIQEQ